MFGFRRKKKAKRTPRRPWLPPAARRLAIMLVVVTGATFALAAGGAFGVTLLDRHVDGLILAESPPPTVHFADLPPQLASLAGPDLENALGDVREQPWLEDGLCEQIGQRVQATGWLAALRYVRRLPGARFEVKAAYRLPAALVQQGSDFALVDWDAVRLPGDYVYHPTWKLIQGVATIAPAAGQSWKADDLRSGLDLWQVLRDEPYADQLTAVLVDNYAGRKNPRAPHIELATDRPGGRIYWGSAPGREVEENAVVQKLTILRENFRRTGRADAGYLAIDITTYPDRFTVPGW
jgi:hypothetical protein